MKKLLVVFTAILVVAFAAPAFATDATWSGEFDFGGITAFDKEDIGTAWGNAYADVTLEVDDYTDVVLEFGWSSQALWEVWYAGLTTDLGSALGLPVGLEMSGGYINIYSNKYEVTGHATERLWVRSNIGTSPMFVAAVDAGMATIKVGFGFEAFIPDDPATAAVDETTVKQDYAVYVDAPGIADMVDVEAGYFIANNDDMKGRFMASAKATDIADMIDVAVGFAYDASADGGLGMEKWFYGVGVKANVNMFGIGVGLAGQEENALRDLTVDVNVGITDEFGIDVGLGLGFGTQMVGAVEEDRDIFSGFEPSVYYTAGAATWRLGYLYSASDINTNNDGDGYAYTAPGDAPVDRSGLFITCGLDF